MGIEAIRAFFSPRRSQQERDGSRPDPVTVAACALLLEIAHADEVFRLAEEERRESVDLYQFTRLLSEHLSREDRLKLVEAIWGVVYSDGSLTEVEAHLARRIAELLGFQHPDVQAAKEKVAARQ